MRLVVCLLAVAWWTIAAVAACPVNTKTRVALVIGNSACQHTRALPDPMNDAVAIARLLRENGFSDVTLLQNPEYGAMREAVRTFEPRGDVLVASRPQRAPPQQPVAGEIIPADRKTVWKPGVTHNGGIPQRTTIFRTLSPRGDKLDDTAQINAALDACPSGQVVQLTAGTFNVTGFGLNFRTSNCTLRGASPGALADGAGGTRLIKADRDTNVMEATLYVNPRDESYGQSANLAQVAPLGAYAVTLASNPGVQVNEIVRIDQVTNNHPDVFWGPYHDGPGGGSRRWFIRQDRSLSQLVEVTAVTGNTITFNTPLHTTYSPAYQAQLTRYAGPFLRNVGIEDLYVYGGRGGDRHGNIAMNMCAYCWVKNVNAHYAEGTNVGFYSTFRSELRDSYIHETPSPSPGGGGYLTGITDAASENLFENNVVWNGNKVIMVRGSGGGNVVAYNYMDDSFGSYYPHLPEAGLNAGHYTTPHMELLEGNYSHNFVGDSLVGNSIDLTIFRNHLSGLRAARPPLNTYTFDDGVCRYTYGDYANRTAVNLQAYSYRHNFVGNVLGMQNQQLLNPNLPGCVGPQDGWVYEDLADFGPGNKVVMWQIGADQSQTVIDGNWGWKADTYKTQLREGNWDWVTRSQRWHGIGGTETTVGTPKPIPNSLYLSSKPGFFGSNLWPWVDPSNGATHTLPARYCYERGQMPDCLIAGAVDTQARTAPSDGFHR